MKYQRYPTYKDSGIEWLGEVPAHWEILPLKRATRTELSNVDKKTVDDQQVVYLCNYLDVYRNELITADMPFMLASASDEQIERLSLNMGDVIITKDSESPDDIGIPALVSESLTGVVCGYHLALIRPTVEMLDGRFLFRFLQGSFARAYFSVEAVGMTRYGLGKSSITDTTILLPPSSEQTSIAAFLDRETAQIDALIARQERLIAVLQEKRQALISHAVTKGLNPAAPMKDSGVEWLGEVPAHWEVKRNKTVFRQVDDRSTTGEEELLSVSHITGVTPRSEKTVNMFMAETLENYKRCQPGDLVINTMWAYMGALGTAKILGVVSPSYNVYRTRNPECMNPQYIDYLYRTPQHVTEIGRNSRGVWESRLRLYPDEFLDMWTPVPPRAEQDQIVKYISQKNDQYAATEDRCRDCIRLLQERRIALISATVTGKIDVRNLVN